MKNLYIIGNGFDLYHKLDTKYQSFAIFLSEKYNEIYELILTYYYLPDLTNQYVTDEDYNLWSEFEIALANLDYEYVLEENSDYVADPGTEDFSDGDWHSYQVEMEMIVKKLTDKLKEAFREFILQVDYTGKDDEKLLLSFESDSFFLNFNYTETLQKFYSIQEEKILYIHNKASDLENEVILGHGTDPKEFEKEEKIIPPENLSPEEFDLWQEEMNDQYDYSYESAKFEILNYYLHSFKNTEEIIKKNSIFFSKLDSLEKIYVLGHSMSEVDIKYFDAIIKNLISPVSWVVSYNREEKKVRYKNIIKKLGVDEDNLTLIKINDLRESDD